MAVKRFRWLGGVVPGKGVLHVRVSDVVTTYGPGDIVERPEHIAELGDKRIADLIASGSAEAVNFIEGKINVVKEVPGAMTDERQFGYYFRDQKSVVTRIPQAFGGRGFMVEGDFLQSVPALWEMLVRRE